MSNAFTHYWRNDTWGNEQPSNAGRAFNHTAGNEFVKRGVTRGDRIYVVTNLAGEMFLAGRLTVDRVVGQGEAERVLRQRLWKARDHVLGVGGTPMRFDLRVPDAVVRRLRFGDGEPLRFATAGVLDNQTLRGVRRITEASAALLDEVLGLAGNDDGRGDGQARSSPVRLVKVGTVDELAENFARFQRTARRHGDRARRIFARTEYWVHDRHSGAFGPGKFLGYRGMDFATYEQARAGNYTGAKFNGGTARLNVQEALGGATFAVDSDLAAECRAWGERLLGEDAWGGAGAGKWKFLSIAVPGREAVTDFPDEVSQPERYPEGATRTVTVNAYERNRKARAACLRHHGTRCGVCDMDFAERYGPTGKGFIHVHHLKAMSEVGEEYEVDPIRDLRPVCPNCHAMLHLSNPPMRLDELRARLRA